MTLLTTGQLPQRSVRSLSLVSTTLYTALFSQLHRTITFGANNEWALNILNVGLFMQDHPSPPTQGIMQDIRRLTIKAPIHLARFHRCVYSTIATFPAHNIAKRAHAGKPAQTHSSHCFSGWSIVPDVSDLRSARAQHTPIVSVHMESISYGHQH